MATIYTSDKICSKCGGIVKDDHLICHKCGNKVALEKAKKKLDDTKYGFSSVIKRVMHTPIFLVSAIAITLALVCSIFTLLPLITFLFELYQEKESVWLLAPIALIMIPLICEGVSAWGLWSGYSSQCKKPSSVINKISCIDIANTTLWSLVGLVFVIILFLIITPVNLYIGDYMSQAEDVTFNELLENPFVKGVINIIFKLFCFTVLPCSLLVGLFMSRIKIYNKLSEFDLKNDGDWSDLVSSFIIAIINIAVALMLTVAPTVLFEFVETLLSAISEITESFASLSNIIDIINDIQTKIEYLGMSLLLLAVYYICSGIWFKLIPNKVRTLRIEADMEFAKLQEAVDCEHEQWKSERNRLEAVKREEEQRKKEEEQRKKSENIEKEVQIRMQEQQQAMMQLMMQQMMSNVHQNTPANSTVTNAPNTESSTSSNTVPSDANSDTEPIATEATESNNQ